MYEFKATLGENVKKDVQLLKHFLKVETNSDLVEKLILLKREEIRNQFGKIGA